jgi:hypothetical protein
MARDDIYRQFVIEKSSTPPSSILVGFKFDRQLQVAHHELFHLKWQQRLQKHAIQHCWTSFIGLRMKVMIYVEI